MTDQIPSTIFLRAGYVKWSAPWSLLVIALSCYFILLPDSVAAQMRAPQKALKEHDGQHDLDFQMGTWKTHIKRLQHPLTGSSTWIEMNGTKVSTPIWNGRAHLEEIEADGPDGHFEGLTLFLYNPQTHQWSQNFAGSRGGTLETPAIGQFRNGRGEFFDQELLDGRAILVRSVWSDITPNSYHFEQAYSDDGGRTWEPNFLATVTRASTAAAGAPPAKPGQDAQHDFDFNFGTWKTHVSRLKQPLTGSNAWVEYEGTSVVHKVWGGKASLLELEVDGPAGHIEGLGLRLYNPESHQWSLNWTNSSDAAVKPMIGEFKNGRGEFFDQELFSGRAVLVRNGFTDITSDSSHFEQALSDDGGKTWETNWIMTFERAQDKAGS